MPSGIMHTPPAFSTAAGNIGEVISSYLKGITPVPVCPKIITESDMAAKINVSFFIITYIIIESYFKVSLCEAWCLGVFVSLWQRKIASKAQSTKLHQGKNLH
jgi:hypothetical protein